MSLLLSQLGGSVVVNPNAGQLILTGFSPTVVVENNTYVFTEKGELFLIGYSPNVIAEGSSTGVVRQELLTTEYIKNRGAHRKDWEYREDLDLIEIVSICLKTTII